MLAFDLIKVIAYLLGAILAAHLNCLLPGRRIYKLQVSDGPRSE